MDKIFLQLTANWVTTKIQKVEPEYKKKKDIIICIKIVWVLVDFTRSTVQKISLCFIILIYILIEFDDTKRWRVKNLKEWRYIQSAPIWCWSKTFQRLNKKFTVFSMNSKERAWELCFSCTLKLWSLRVRLVGGVEKLEDGKYLVFLLVCLVGGVEKWKGEKLFCLVGEKKERMKNVIYIN